VRVDQAGGSGMLASVRATGTRSLVIAYYGTDSPGGRAATVPWRIRVAVSRDRGASFSNSQVSPRVAYTGSEASEQGHIYDLLALLIDPQGLIDVAWAEDPYVAG